jgi:hypothetical protein
MLRIVVACLILAGCAAPPPLPPRDVPPSPMGRADPRFIPAASAPAEMERRRAAENERGRELQAAAVCSARADMAGATYAGRGWGIAGAMTAGAEAAVAAERVRAACMDGFRASGVMPSP